MAIYYNENTKTITLQTAHTTYQMLVGPHGYLLHTYYGPTAEGDLSYRLVCREHSFSGTPYEERGDRAFSLDYLPQEYPCEGSGDYRLTAFGLRSAAGISGCDLRYAGHTIQQGKYGIDGLPAVYAGEDEAQTLRVTLRDENAGVEVELLYGVLPRQDTITRAARVCNTGAAPLTVQAAASTALDWLTGQWDLLHFSGRYGDEHTARRAPLGRGELRLGSRRGTSSHQNAPFVILADHSATEDHGLCCGVSLLYSGSFCCRCEQDQFDQLRLTMGLQDERLDYPLAPGEWLDTPEAAMILTDAGLSDLSHKFHALLRGNVCRGPWKNRRRPILINNWEATMFDFDGETLLKIASQAAELGVEMMVLDDGWFGKRDDDNSGLGDWWVNEAKLGGTLQELAGRINAMGMRFGLWIEPEMVNEDSQLYREHPDWAFALPGKPPVMSRNQRVLDFSRPEVVDEIFRRISAVLDGAHVEYIKMDMNRSLADVCTVAEGMQSQGAVLYRYMRGVYDFMQRLLDRYPGLLLEGCSGGGGRFDAGMLYYCSQIWCSDDTDAIERIGIQYGTSFGYPVSAVGAHVSVAPNEQTGRITPLHTRAVVAMAGSFGYELDLNLLSDQEKQQVRRQIADFKRFWPLLHNGLYYRLTDCTQNREEAAWMMVAPDGSEALLNLVTLNTHCNAPVRYLFCRGLQPDARYRSAESGEEYSGAALMYAGLPVPQVPGEYNAWQMHFVRV